MNVVVSKQFKKSYDRLPQLLQKKTKKAINQLEHDMFYPGLNTKKKEGNTWEARVDRSYRLTFEKQEDTLYLRIVGPHDKGLEKK